MRGKSTLRIDRAAMLDAVQAYIDDEISPDHKVLNVCQVVSAGGADQFEIEIETAITPPPTQQGWTR